jgi:hypothetical protein
MIKKSQTPYKKFMISRHNYLKQFLIYTLINQIDTNYKYHKLKPKNNNYIKHKLKD